MKIKKYEKKVSVILLNKPKARDCDYVLYAFVLLSYNVNIHDLSTKDFLKGLHDKIYPSFEGVSRCRRKLQEKHTELRGSRWGIEHLEQESI